MAYEAIFSLCVGGCKAACNANHFKLIKFERLSLIGMGESSLGHKPHQYRGTRNYKTEGSILFFSQVDVHLCTSVVLS